MCVQKLHSNQMCHGDLKQRNVIRLGEKWVLCDMDAAAHFEEPIGSKTSTAYCPPELYQLKHSQHNESTTILNASASFDVWSFGVLLFELCSGQTLFSQDIANDELVSTADRMRLCSWHTISDEELEPVLRGLAHGSFPLVPEGQPHAQTQFGEAPSAPLLVPTCSAAIATTADAVSRLLVACASRRKWYRGDALSRVQTAGAPLLA